MKYRTNDVQKARPNGSSVYIAVTGFIDAGDNHKIERIDDENIKLMRIR